MGAYKLRPGEYRCTANDLALPSCRVQNYDGRLLLTFDGPTANNNLVDNYSGTPIGTRQEISVMLVNHFNPNLANQADTRIAISLLKLSADGHGYFSGLWAFEGGRTYEFKMSPKDNSQ